LEDTELQVRDAEKCRRIEAAAAEMFAARPFHEVTLDEIAAAAAVGKGTVYTYFKSKEALYLSVLYDGFSGLVEQLKAGLEDGECEPREALGMVVTHLVDYVFRNPHIFRLSRNVEPTNNRPRWEKKRRELGRVIEGAIRRGIAAGCWHDSHPEWTAQFIPGMVRSTVLYGGGHPSRKALARQILHYIEAGLLAGQ